MRLSKLSEDERGFTFIELLVVIVLIGILASIALAAFLGQREKGQDAATKSDVRNMVSEIESCFTDRDAYVGCTAALTTSSTNLDIGSGPGQVEITAENATGYTVVGTSRAASGGVRHTFTFTHLLRSADQRTCTVPGKGGCPASGRW